MRPSVVGDRAERLDMQIASFIGSRCLHSPSPAQLQRRLAHGYRLMGLTRNPRTRCGVFIFEITSAWFASEAARPLLSQRTTKREPCDENGRLFLHGRGARRLLVLALGTCRCLSL